MISHSQMALLGPKLARCFHQRIPPAPLCVALAARSRRVSPVSAALPRTSEGICQVMCAMVKLHGIYGFYEEQWGYGGNMMDIYAIKCIYIYQMIYVVWSAIHAIMQFVTIGIRKV